MINKPTLLMNDIIKYIEELEKAIKLIKENPKGDNLDKVEMETLDYVKTDLQQILDKHTRI